VPLLCNTDNITESNKTARFQIKRSLRYKDQRMIGNSIISFVIRSWYDSKLQIVSAPGTTDNRSK